MGFHHGLSGLNAASKSLDVSGHNIANSNTIGFKKSRAEFNEMVASAMGSGQCPGSAGAGIGVSVAAVTQQFSQGVITPTANGLDMAINGDGFFVVNTPSGTAYTRNGAFQLDKNGFLVTANGDKVQGWADANATGTQPVDLQFPTGAGIPGRQTTGLSIQAANLPATAPAASSVMPNTPRHTYGTSVQVYDSQGVAIPVEVYFVKMTNLQPVANPNYDPSLNLPVMVTDPVTGASVPNPDVRAHEYQLNTAYDSSLGLPTSIIDPDTGLTVPNPDMRAHMYQMEGVGNQWAVFDSLTGNNAVGQIQFDGQGQLVSGGSLTLNVDPSVANPNNPPAPFNVSLDLSGMTQNDRKWSVDKMTQDGYASGELTGVNVSKDGTLMASYSNGLTRPEGKVALARFTNPQGLAPNGNNNWVQTNDSGPVLYGSAGSGSFGQITGCALEESNVDLTAELVGMMTAQRSYQANAQTIKTQDQVFSTLVNLR